jgi:hypothetical protein
MAATDFLPVQTQIVRQTCRHLQWPVEVWLMKPVCTLAFPCCLPFLAKTGTHMCFRAVLANILFCNEAMGVQWMSGGFCHLFATSQPGSAPACKHAVGTAAFLLLLASL